MSHLTPEQSRSWLEGHEDEHFEFKEAKDRFDFEKLVKYCCALANEGGGKVILGVRDKKPRTVVGSNAFENLERTKAGLIDRLHLRIEVELFPWESNRVLIFHVPPRPIGMPIQYNGAYWMRGGEDLIPMTPDKLKRIFDESGPDFSAEICPQATIDFLEPIAIQRLRERWHRKSKNDSLLSVTNEQLLTDAELIIDEKITYAALILLGTRSALGRLLGQGEVIFEYRSNDASLSSQDRLEYRQGFFTFDDEIWKIINLRNDTQHFQDGLFIWDVPTFNERVVREALLNAISHRDYRLGASVFIRQYPRRLEIVSPGGFPQGVNPENILWRQNPRNRRIAEVLARCGLVERSGQGVNAMFEESIKESKPRPDFTGTDDYQVFLTLRGEVQDVRFLRFLEQVGRETLLSFTTEDLLILDTLRHQDAVPEEFTLRLKILRERGLVETIGTGKGTKYLLSKRFYMAIGDKAAYTRRRGLDRETNKALLIKHLEHYAAEGSQLRDLIKVLPNLSRGQIQSLMKELKQEGRAYPKGKTKGGRWFPGSAP
jgi:ATP-dependent DNA helicase RecG